ncbi:MAG: peptide chain release factor N(5)-glutamine methyltransferase [Methylocystaceae bacterium]|nr:peptide chain release factor N(5)-glutamine methyltransferase [Methylocystaceae bacterium]
MKTIGETLQQLVETLTKAGIDEARTDARLLLEHVLDVDRTVLIAYPEREISQDQCAELDALLKRRLNREPMSHLLGYREFWSLRFKVTKETLTPRPDSETLIEAVLRHLPDVDAPLNVLDLGVGTGCLILSVLSEYKKAHGLGIDLSDDALRVAIENAKMLGLADRCDFQIGDWMEGLNDQYDLILSNPPYIPTGDKSILEPEVLVHEPATALFAGSDGLDDYRILAQQLPGRLKDDALAVIELGIDQSDAVLALMESCGLEVIDSPKDLGGIVRCHIIRKKT